MVFIREKREKIARVCVLAAICLLLFGFSFAQGKTIVTVSIWDSDAPVVQAIAEQYEKSNPDVNINVEVMSRITFREETNTALMARDGRLDVVWMSDDQLSGFAAGGFLEPLGKYLDEPTLPDAQREDWALEKAIESCIYQKEMYGFPVQFGAVMLMYRTDLFKNAGITYPPITWEEYLEVAKKLTGNGIYGTTIWGKLPESIAWDFINFPWSFGGELFDSETYEPLVNREAWVEAMTFYSDLYRKYKVVPPGSTIYEYPEVLTAFQNSKIAMCIQWQAAIRDLTDSDKSPEVYDKLGLALVPGKRMLDGSVNRAAICHPWLFGICKDSKNKREAYKFLVALKGKENSKYWFELGSGDVPNSKTFMATPEAAKFPGSSIMAKSASFMRTWPANVVTPKLILALAKEASTAVAGEKTPQEAVESCARTFDSIFRREGLK